MTLVPNYCVGTNVYLWNESKNAAVKFLSSEQLVTEATFAMLSSNPKQLVYVDESCYESFQEYLIQHLDEWLAHPRVPRILKTTSLAEYMHCQVSKALKSIATIDELIACALHCGELLGKYGSEIGMQGREVHRILKHDESYETHAVNTTFYAFLIAETMGLSGSAIIDVAVGAMLHDVGKLKIESEQGVSKWDTSLGSEQEDRLLQTHPIEGFRVLCQNTSIREVPLLVCYQHHERPDGEGFPVGLIDEEILMASKICAVANRFDGLTSDRKNRKAMNRITALRILMTERNHAYHAEVVRCLDQCMN